MMSVRLFCFLLLSIGMSSFAPKSIPRAPATTLQAAVLDLPCTDVKVAPLRFFLQLWLVSVQNEPSPNTWLVQQDDENNLFIYHSDGSARLSLDLTENGLKVTQDGTKPSLPFQLQSAVLLHGLLDQLEEISAEKREDPLFVLDSDSLEKARTQLPAKPA